MSNNPGPDLPRRKLLALLGGGSLAGLAGCQGDGGGSGDVTPTEGSDGRDDEGVTPTATSTVTATPVDADPEIVVPSDSLLEYEDGSAVPVGSELVIDCRGIDEELDAILDVENPSREELNGGCGDSFVFDEEGLYLMQLQAADGNTIVGRTETQLEALTVPEVSVSQIPGEMKEGEGYVVAYDSSNANLTHTVEMPEGWTEEYTGDQFQITPSEPGKTNITTETNAEIGNQRITRTIPIQPDSEISQEDNLEKRIEAAESFPKMERGGAYSVYDVEALRKLLDDPELKQIIHPEL